jgi:hypothetical protein
MGLQAHQRERFALLQAQVLTQLLFAGGEGFPEE